MTAFTPTELSKAGPMFNPEHRLVAEIKQALRQHELAERALAKRAASANDLKDAKARVLALSLALKVTRGKLGMELVRERTVLARVQADRDYYADDAAYQRDVKWSGAEVLHLRINVRRLELDVLAAHDSLWTAQRMVALWDFTYGSQPTGANR
jgi:hypothetical protein